MRKSKKPIFDFKGVFNPQDYLYFYEDVLKKERTEIEIQFLVKELELEKSMKILDLACGHGRHTNRLAELGYIVTGVDNNLGFLKIAKDEAKKKGINVKYIKKDMRKINFSEEFDRVILLFTSFGYFVDEENLLILKNVARALKKGGLFCFDTFNRDIFLKNLHPCVVIEKGENFMIDRHNFDSLTGRLYNNRIIIRNGKRKDTPFFVRLYNPTEIKYLLKEAGLSLYKIYSDFASSPFKSESGRMVIIAEKELNKNI